MVCGECSGEDFFLNKVAHAPGQNCGEIDLGSLIAIFYTKLRIARIGTGYSSDLNIDIRAGNGTVFGVAGSGRSLAEIILSLSSEIEQFPHPSAACTDQIIHGGIVDPSGTCVQ